MAFKPGLLARSRLTIQWAAVMIALFSLTAPIGRGTCDAQECLEVKHEHTVWNVFYTADSRYLVSFSSNYEKDARLAIWNRAERRLEHVIGSLDPWAFADGPIAGKEPGGRFVTSSERGFCIWSVETGALISRIEVSRPRQANAPIVVSPWGYIAVGHEDGTVRIWDGDGSQINKIESAGAVGSLAFSMSGDRLAVGSKEQEYVEIRDLRTDRLMAHAGDKNEARYVTAMEWYGKEILAFSSVRKDPWGMSQIKIVDLAGPRVRHVLPGGPAGIARLIAVPSSETLVSIGSGSQIQPPSLYVWDLQSATERSIDSGRAKRFAGTENSVAVSHEGTMLALSGYGNRGSIDLVDARSGELLKTFNDHKKAVWSLAFSPDDRELASGSSDGSVRIWQLRD